MRTPSLRAAFSWTPIDKDMARDLGLQGQVQKLAPRDFADIRLILDKSVWVEIPLAERWLAAFRLVNKHGIPSVAELRVFPLPPGPQTSKRPAGRWSGEYGEAQGVPPGGLTARQLRMVRFQTFKRALRKVLARHGEALSSLAGDVPDIPRSVPQAATRGRKGRPDTELAKIAAIYEQAHLSDNPPVAAVAKACRLSLTQARDVVRRARTRGLLTAAHKQGSGGGLLTPQARALLAYDRDVKEGGRKHGKKR